MTAVRRPAVGATDEAGDPAARAKRLSSSVRRLMAMLTHGHPELVFNISRGFAVYDKQRQAYEQASWVDAGTWRRARVRTTDGVEVDRHVTEHVLHQHVLGKFDVAVEAPTFCSLIAFDLDRMGHRGGAAVDPRVAGDDLRARLGRLWQAFGCSTEKPLVVLETPSGGLHAYLALDQLWPMEEALPWVAHHLAKHRLSLRDGALELFPCGKPLRAPCGRGTALVEVVTEGDQVAELRPLHVTTKLATDRRGQRIQRRYRDRAALVDGFVSAIEQARRPLHEWVHDAPTWDRVWGPYGRREKGTSGDPTRSVLSQHIEDFGARGPAPRPGLVPGLNHSLRPAPPVVSLPGERPSPPGSPAAHLVRGSLWRSTIAGLFSEGITVPGTRHNAVLKVTWQLAVVLGLPSWETVKEKLIVWLEGHEHVSETRLGRGQAQFVQECLREAQHYYRTRCQDLPRRPSAAASPLCAVDNAMVDREFSPELREPARRLLQLLSSRAEPGGRVLAPVALGAATLEAELGDHRLVAEDGQRRRRHVVLLEQFLAKGLLTLHSNYRVGASARRFCCWYVFGSGQLPATRDDGRIALGTRAIREGELVALSTGAPLARVSVELQAVTPEVPSRSKAWWKRMYERRDFTPLEFFTADALRVVPFPAERIRPEVAKTPPTGQSLGRFDGTVESFSYARGYGFIIVEDGRRAFVHQEDLDLPGFRALEDEDQVSFELLQGARGLRAAAVTRFGHRSPVALCRSDEQAPSAAVPERATTDRTQEVPVSTASPRPSVSSPASWAALGRAPDLPEREPEQQPDGASSSCRPGCACKLCWTFVAIPLPDPRPAPPSPAEDLAARRAAFGPCAAGCVCQICWEERHG